MVNMIYDDELSKIDNEIFERKNLLRFHKMEINSLYGFRTTQQNHKNEIYKLKKELNTLLKQKLRVKKLIRIIED